jgi:hypothetical protein
MKRRRSKYSLASLLLLVAGISVMFAATRSAVPRWHDRELAMVCMGAGGTFGALVGTCMGLMSYRPFVGAFAGLLAGGVTGAMAGAQLAAPPDFLIVVLGSATLIALSLALRPKLRSNEERAMHADHVKNDASPGPQGQQNS